MKGLIRRTGCLAAAALLSSTMAWAAESGAQSSALTCADFVPTEAALERFPDLEGACEDVVERDGELYALFRAVVRRAGSQTVTLYLPATDHTFRVEPNSDARVLMGGSKVRMRQLQRGQEVSGS